MRVFQRFLLLVVEGEIVVEAEHGGYFEGIEGAAFLLRGAAGAACAIDESADTAHLENLVLLGRGDVLIDFGQELRADTLFNGFEHAERVGDGGLAHAHHLTCLQRSRGFYVLPVDGDATVLDCIDGNGAGLEDAGRPKPLVYSCLAVHISGRFSKGVG